MLTNEYVARSQHSARESEDLENGEEGEHDGVRGVTRGVGMGESSPPDILQLSLCVSGDRRPVCLW